MTILVAGDQRLRDSLLPSLAQRGYALVFATSSERFATLIRTHRLDLIIMDLDTLAKDRFRTQVELQGVLERLSVPIVAVAESARVTTPHLKELWRFLRQNAAAVLNRPLDLKQLEQEVARVLGDEVPGTDCLTERTLSRLVDEELSEEEAERAHEHLSECAMCERRLDEWKRTDSLFRGSFETVMMTRMHSSRDCISPKRLTAYFRGGLPAAERADVEAHLARCVFCTRELVALYNLMRDFDEKELEPLGEEILHRLKSGMRELLRKAKGPLICIQCVGSIPLGSDSCPECGAVVRGKAQEKELPAKEQAANGPDEEERATRPNGGYVGTRKVQAVASLLALAVMASAVLAGIAVNQNRDLRRSATVAVEGRRLVARTGEDSGIAALFEGQIEEKIEVFGQIAMYEPSTQRFDVPANVNRIARGLIAQHYYDASIADRALQHDDIWDVLTTLNGLETKGSKAPLLPKPRNRIFTPDEVRILKAELSGDFTGLGTTFRLSAARDGCEITGFTPNSPAQEAGLQVGDVITEIDGTSLSGLSLVQMAGLGRGPVGTTPTLKVARQGVPEFQLRVPRENSSVYVVEHSAIGFDTVYLRVNPLTRAVPERLKDVLSDVSTQGVKNLVLDLRDNTGGSVQAALDIAALFLPARAPIARIESRNRGQHYYSEGEAIWDGPLAVLVNRHTLSGAELIASALQGNRRGIIVGERTAGKGSVQTLYKLSNECAFQLTTDVLLGADGLVFQNRGVEPDIELVGIDDDEMRRHYGGIRNDVFVQAALEGLESG